MPPTDDLNDLATLASTPEESFTGTGDELPSQGSGFTPTIMPGIHLFALPANIDQLWKPIDVEKKDALGNKIPDPNNAGAFMTERHLQLKLDKDNPLVCVDGDGTEFDGLPASMTVSTVARKRGKADDAPVVSDMTYFVRKALKDNSPVVNRGDWMTIVNKYAGRQIRLETGLSAQCDPERTRYVSDGAGGVLEDPSGAKGCGMGPGGKVGGRYYTSSFKVKELDELGTPTGRMIWSSAITCSNCGAALRGFFRVEKFLEPMGQQAGNAGQTGVGQGTLA